MTLEKLVTHDDLKIALERMETRLDKKIDLLEAKLDKSVTELNGKFTWLQWMFGFLLAGIVSIVVKLFLQ